MTVWVVQPPLDKNAQCLSEVAGGVAYALKRLGHTTRLSYGPYQRDALPPGRLVVFNAHRLPSGAVLPADTILFNAEQVQTEGALGAAWRGSDYLALLRRHLVWDYCATNIASLRALGVERLALCRVGYYPKLAGIAPALEDLDVLFVGSRNERRDQLFAELGKARIRCRVLTGVFGAERDHWIARARIVLNVHFYPQPIWEIFRVSHLLANRKCVVSESGGRDAALEEFAALCTAHVPYEQIVATCQALLREPKDRRALALRGQRALLRIDQVEEVRQALAAFADSPIAVPRKRARILGADNRGGLTRDALVLQRQLQQAGWEVERTEPTEVPRPLADAQFFLERVNPALLAAGRRNVVIPNPEFWDEAATQLLPMVDVWTKTPHADRVFAALGARHRLIGWTSVDRLDPEVPREPTFLHVCGQSNRKGTSGLVRAWKPAWPLLTIIASPATWWAGRPECAWIDESHPPNVRVVTEYLSDDLLRELQNRAMFHIYPSLYEGFGHAIWEGLSCGARVLIPGGAPPFDEMPAIFDRMAAGEPLPSGLVQDHPVAAQLIADAVEWAMRTRSTDDVHASEKVARSAWLDNEARFEALVALQIEELTVTYEDTAPGTAPIEKLVVCHSQHAQCGIAEYGRQLDAEFRRQGWAPAVFSYAEPEALAAACDDRTVLLVHFEPALMPRPFLDVLRQARVRGTRVVVCCHWFGRELLEHELAVTTDRFVVHRDYGVEHPRLVQIPLGCPDYTPSADRAALRRRFGIAEDEVVLTTLGFLSGWKRTPELIDAVLGHPAWQDPRLRLWIQTPPPFSGDTAQQIPAMEAVLQRRGRQRVTFSTEFLPEQQLLDLVHASDLGFIFHGQNTGSASAASKQFVSAACPLVITLSSHTADVQAGVVRVSPFDPATFAEVLFRTAADPAACAELRAGMAREQERLSMATVARRYLDLFGSL